MILAAVDAAARRRQRGFDVPAHGFVERGKRCRRRAGERRRTRRRVRKELRRWLRALHDELHVTSIFVTHDQEEALEVADQVVIMNGGGIEQIGGPAEVCANPATPFVGDFLDDVIGWQATAWPPTNGSVIIPRDDIPATRSRAANH